MLYCLLCSLFSFLLQLMLLVSCRRELFLQKLSHFSCALNEKPSSQSRIALFPVLSDEIANGGMDGNYFSTHSVDDFFFIIYFTSLFSFLFLFFNLLLFSLFSFHDNKISLMLMDVILMSTLFPYFLFA